MRKHLKIALVSTPIGNRKRGNGKKLREPSEGSLTTVSINSLGRGGNDKDFLETALETRPETRGLKKGQKNPLVSKAFTPENTMKNIQSEVPATVSARKTYRPLTAISVALVTKVTLELGRTEDGTYSHARFETVVPDFEKDIQRTTELLQGVSQS